ncbi:MAG: hypothetical protein GY863_25580 [bacterium]|nr:hypothetical protein [bacterium]
MRKIFIILSFVGLCLTVLPSFFVMKGMIEWETHSKIMFFGMILWFAFAGLWMKKNKSNIQ